jgi:PAS domain S-box-containing protein
MANNNFKDLVLSASIYVKTDTKGIILDVNDAFCKISGFSQKELVGKTHALLRHPLESKLLFESLWKELKSNKQWSGVIRNRTKKERDFYLHSTIMPILENGISVAYMAISFDMTEVMAQRQALQWQEHITETILDNQMNILAIYSNVDGFIRVNQPFYDLFNVLDLDEFTAKFEFIDDCFIKEEGYVFRDGERDLLDFLDDIALDDEKIYKAKIRKEDETIAIFTLKVAQLMDDERTLISFH